MLKKAIGLGVVLALAAACGGSGDKAEKAAQKTTTEAAAPAPETPAAEATPVVTPEGTPVPIDEAVKSAAEAQGAAPAPAAKD
ncbi:MAG: hypothetical protein ACRD0C_18525, partial [Acidimicrobiia bacterium]